MHARPQIFFREFCALRRRSLRAAGIRLSARCSIAPTVSTIASAQTLNLLENDFFLPILVGFALFGILTGLAVVVGRILPKWTGWVMFAFGLACLAGPIGFLGLLATVLWALVAGIWMVKQGPPVPDRVTPLAEDRVTV